MEYIQRVRTQAAIFTLRETRDKVSTIARRFGFYDGPHLAFPSGVWGLAAGRRTDRTGQLSTISVSRPQVRRHKKDALP